MKTVLAVVAVLSTSLLAACSRAPGDAELHQALQRATGLGDSKGKPSEVIQKAKVLDCEKEPTGKAYRCNVIGPFGMAQTMRLIQDGDGWIILN